MSNECSLAIVIVNYWCLLHVALWLVQIGFEKADVRNAEGCGMRMHQISRWCRQHAQQRQMHLSRLLRSETCVICAQIHEDKGHFWMAHLIKSSIDLLVELIMEQRITTVACFIHTHLWIWNGIIKILHIVIHFPLGPEGDPNFNDIMWKSYCHEEKFSIHTWRSSQISLDWFVAQQHSD